MVSGGIASTACCSSGVRSARGFRIAWRAPRLRPPTAADLSARGKKGGKLGGTIAARNRRNGWHREERVPTWQERMGWADLGRGECRELSKR